MLHTLRTKKLPDIEVEFKTKINLLTPVTTSKDGVVVVESVFQPYDIAGMLAPYKSSDFSIMNLEQIGALGKLKTTYMSQLHDMNVADRFESYQIPVGDVQ